jgi:hypothetical protein
VKGAFEMVEITYYGKRIWTWWEVFEFSWLEQKSDDEKYRKIKEWVEEQGKDPHCLFNLIITVWFWNYMLLICLVGNESELWIANEVWYLVFIVWEEKSSMPVENISSVWGAAKHP